MGRIGSKLNSVSRITRLPHPFEPDRGAETRALFPGVEQGVGDLLAGTGGCSPYLKGLCEKEQAWLTPALSDAEAEIEALEQAAALAAYRLDRTRLVSTVDGTVLVRIREPGAVVLGNSPVYSIAIDDPVWVRTYVDEPNLGRVFPGMTALVMTDTDPEAPYEGWVGFISPTAEFTPKTVETPELRTDLVYRLRVYVANPDRRLRQGMPVTVELVPEVFDRSAAGARALAAPAEAQQPSPETRDDRQP